MTKLAGFEYTKNIAPNLTEDGIPLFKGKNVQDSTIIYEFESYIPEHVSDELARSQITRKCILTPYVGTIGNIGIHDQPGKYHLGSNVGKVELYNEFNNLMEEWVVYYLKSQYGYNQLTKHMKATAQASISIAAIRDVYLPIPPGREQHRICDEISKVTSSLSEIDDSKDDVTELISITKKKILDLAIRGKLVPQDSNDEPASVLLEKIRTEKESLIKQGKLKREKKESIIYKGDDNSYYENMVDGTVINITNEVPFMIPESWSFVRLCNLFELISGRDLTPTEYNDISNGIPYITGASNFTDGKVKINRWTTVPKVKTKVGDLLVTCKGTVGELSINELGEAHIARQIMAIRNPYAQNIRYLKLCIAHYVETLKQKSKGLIPGISREDILNLLIPIAPISEQQKIVQAVESYLNLIDNIKASLQ